MQYFDWGYIEWIYEPDFNNSSNNMNIGITTILPHKRQNKHIHYGNEQFIYVLSGEGIQLIGDKISEMKPKQIYHMEAGTIHETINHGDKPIKHLLIAIPVNNESNIVIQKEESNIDGLGDNFDDTIMVNNEIKYIYDTIVAPLNLPISIFDMEGNIVIQGKDYPQFCKSKCLVDAKNENCPMYSLKGEYKPPHYTDLSAFICPYGLTVVNTPIMLNTKPIGIIKGGHIKTSRENSDSGIENIVPKGTVNAVLQQLKKLSRTIQSYYIFKNAEIKLNKKEEIIQGIVKNEVALEETLKSAREKVLNIQINNHFLFNTLNALAGMAIKENAVETYQSIIDISNMLRYTSTSDSQFVQLKNELQYLQNYTNLQKLRYRERLKVIMDISPEVDDKNIPFNCLQPIVENCFIHGFKDMKQGMEIYINARVENKNIIFEIIDNGKGMNEEELNILRQKIRGYEKYELRGLMMIFSKLKLFYGDNFNLIMESDQCKGTKVKIVIPEYLV